MIMEKFKEWLFAEPERRQKYVEYYNETFQCQDTAPMSVMKATA